MALRLFDWNCPTRDLCVVQWGPYVGFAYRQAGQHHAEVRRGDRVVGSAKYVEGWMGSAKSAAEDLLLDHMRPEQRSLVYRARAAGLSAPPMCRRGPKRSPHGRNR